MDNAFENISHDANPVTPVPDEWGETSANCEPFAYGDFHLEQRSASCDKLIGGWFLFSDEIEIRNSEINGEINYGALFKNSNELIKIDIKEDQLSLVGEVTNSASLIISFIFIM